MSDTPLLARPEVTEVPAPRPRSSWRRIGNVLVALAPALGILGFLGVWQLLVVVFDVRTFVLPSPWKIVSELADAPGFYASNARTTLWEAFLGFAIAALVGTVVAAAMAHSRFVDRAVLPVAVLVQVTPIIAYAPAAVLWLGFGLKPILLLTSMVGFVPFVINGVAGMRSVDPSLLELARSVDAGRWEIFVRLRLPSSLPFLFSAARIAVGLALIGAVLGEFFSGTSHGLGFVIKRAQNGLTVQLWGCVYVLALLGGLATLLVAALERRVLHWHSSQRT
jgi:NitT/TauT family transport system permease protein